MPRRQKSFTRSPGANSDPQTHYLSTNAGRSRPGLRALIAHAAAKLVAEGLTDYNAARQKAARQLGVTDRQWLPDHHEIELSLREHLSLFAQETQPRALSMLRETALHLMPQLEQFSPWLVGAVLTGTANEFSGIELELIAADAKQLEVFLLNAGVDFALSEPDRFAERGSHRQPIKYQLEFNGVPVSILLFVNHAVRHAAHPHAHSKFDRADYREATARFCLEALATQGDASFRPQKPE